MIYIIRERLHGYSAHLKDPSFLQITLVEGPYSFPLFDYTTVPLDTTQCTSFKDTCSAVQAIVDDMNAFVDNPDVIQICTLSAHCLTITCVKSGDSDTITTTVTLSPCDSTVTVSIESRSNISDFTFSESGIRTIYVHNDTTLLLDVTFVRLQDGAAVGLQVSYTIVL